MDGRHLTGTIRATFELEPHGSAEALAIEESTGMPDGPGFVRGRVVSEGGGVAVLEFPAANWGRNVPMLLSALVAGEGVETRAFSRCRLVDLSLPEGLLPGPVHGAGLWAGARVGCIVKPSLGLRPAEVAEVGAAIARGGAALIKDDELMGDPEWCPLDDRVKAVMDAVGSSGVIYTPNITGPSPSLLDRAHRVVELGANGVMVNAFTQGLDAVLALRDADLGVPIFAHRVGSGPWARNDRFGVAGAVLARLTRLCGADFVQVGAFAGKLFDSDREVEAQLAAASEAPAAVAVLGGGIGPDNAAGQAQRAAEAGAGSLLMLLGSAAYRHPGGIGAGVRASVEALDRPRRPRPSGPSRPRPAGRAQRSSAP